MTTATAAQKFLVVGSVEAAVEYMTGKLAQSGYSKEAAAAYITSPDGLANVMRFAEQIYSGTCKEVVKRLS